MEHRPSQRVTLVWIQIATGTGDSSESVERNGYPSRILGGQDLRGSQYLTYLLLDVSLLQVEVRDAHVVHVRLRGQFELGPPNAFE